jgi:glycosyltransferase involved in cell wall biosynthesis
VSAAAVGCSVCLHEAARILSVINDIRAEMERQGGRELIVVDVGAVDETAAIVAESCAIHADGKLIRTVHGGKDRRDRVARPSVRIARNPE